MMGSLIVKPLLTIGRLISTLHTIGVSVIAVLVLFAFQPKGYAEILISVEVHNAATLGHQVHCREVNVVQG
jgi:hypothetical protein